MYISCLFCGWFLLTILLSISPFAWSFPCQQYDNHGIRVDVIRHVTNENNFITDEVQRSMATMRTLNEINHELLEQYGIGLIFYSIKTVTACPSYSAVDRRIRLIISNGSTCLKDPNAFDKKNKADLKKGPGFNFIVPQASTMEDRKAIFLEHIDRFELDRLIEEKFLVARVSRRYNGVTESGEHCDTIYSTSQLPCSNGIISAAWTVQYSCPMIPNCSTSAPFLICQKGSVTYPPMHCTELIDYDPPYPSFPAYQNDVCINPICENERIAWGVNFSPSSSSSNLSEFKPFNAAIYDSRYKCGLPPGYEDREITCYDSNQIKRPDHLPLVCGVKILVDGVETWYQTDNDRCSDIPKPSTLCTQEDLTRQGYVNIPPCLTYLCASQDAYNNDQFSEFVPCSTSPDAGFAEAHCNINKGTTTRHVGCYFMNMLGPNPTVTFTERDLSYCEERVGEGFETTRQLPCTYRWRCYTDDPSTFVECENCSTRSCLAPPIQTHSVCIWEDGQDQGPVDADAWCEHERPSLYGSTCATHCSYHWGCEYGNAGYVPCHHVDISMYTCIPDDENAECGEGAVDFTNVGRACLIFHSTTSTYNIIDDGGCNHSQIPHRSCTVDCMDDWYCQTYATDTGDLVPNLYSCSINQVKESLRNRGAHCGTREYQMKLMCPEGVTCPLPDRPSDIPANDDTVLFTITHTDGCGAGCFDAAQHNYTLGDVFDIEHAISCVQWHDGQVNNSDLPLGSLLTRTTYACSATQPCEAGLVQRGIVCIDHNQHVFFVRTSSGEMGDITNCQQLFGGADDSIQLTSSCIQYDPDLCKGIPHCSFQYIEQYAIVGEDIIPHVPFKSNRHAFNVDNCSVEDWDTILIESKNKPKSLSTTTTSDSDHPDDDNNDDDHDENNHQKVCGDVGRIHRCYIVPQQSSSDAEDPQGYWFPDFRLCTQPRLFQTAGTFAIANHSDSTYDEFYKTDAFQQSILMFTFHAYGCARWRCKRSLPGLPESTSLTVNYCYSESNVCSSTALDHRVDDIDRCDEYTYAIQGSCHHPNLIGSRGKRRDARAIVENDYCDNVEPYQTSVKCPFYDHCDTIRRECRFNIPSSFYSPQICRDACKTPLCGKAELLSACFAYSKHTPQRRVQIDMKYCIEQEQAENNEIHLPEECVNYMQCTYWACSPWTASVNLLSSLSTTDTLSTLSKEECANTPTKNALQSICSVPCGRGAIQRHVACISNGEIVPVDPLTTTRCGLQYNQPPHQIPCENDPDTCVSTHECNIAHLPLSREKCSWSTSPDSCPSICDRDSSSQDTPTPYVVDIISRCVYRGTDGLLYAPEEKCAREAIPNPQKSCPRDRASCCNSGSDPFGAPQSQAQCTIKPIESAVLTALQVGRQVATLPIPDNAPPTATPIPVMAITLDDTYTRVSWSFSGTPIKGSTISLYLIHPQLQIPYLIDTFPADAVNSFSYTTVTVIPSGVIPPVLPTEDGTSARLTDPSKYATVVAYLNPKVYTILQYVEIHPNAYPTHLLSPPLPTYGTGVDHSYCNQQPCYNGKCIEPTSSKGTATCQCYGGYTGLSCERPPAPPPANSNTPPENTELVCPTNAIMVPTLYTTDTCKYSLLDIPLERTPLTHEAYEQLVESLTPTCTPRSFKCQCLHQFFGDNCDECRLVCSADHGKPNDTCSSCICDSGYTGTQCNCRRVFLPIYHHRAPPFLEQYFQQSKHSTKTASTTGVIDLPDALRSQFIQWKRIVLNDIAIDLSYPVSSLDLVDYGYHTTQGSTHFLLLISIDICQPLVEQASFIHGLADSSALSDQLSQPGPDDTFRAGNVIDLTLASILLREYTKSYSKQIPITGGVSQFLTDIIRSAQISQADRIDYQYDATQDGIDIQDNTEMNTVSLTHSLDHNHSTADHTLLTSVEDFLSLFFVSQGDHHIMNDAMQASTPLLTRAHNTPSASLILQTVYHMPSSIATGVAQAAGAGFVRTEEIIDLHCHELQDQETCYGQSKLPKVKKMPYNSASKKGPPVTLILILIFCVVLPLIILAVVIFYCWRKSIGLFKSKEEKDLEETDTFATDASQSGTQLTEYKGGKRRGGDSKHSARSMTTASAPHQLEDPDLHPDWKKVMGPAGEPIYINDTTLKSSKVRPLPDGSIPTQRSMFHRPTIFARK